MLTEDTDAATAEVVRRAMPLERLGGPGEIARAERFFVESRFATRRHPRGAWRAIDRLKGH